MQALLPPTCGQQSGSAPHRHPNRGPCAPASAGTRGGKTRNWSCLLCQAAPSCPHSRIVLSRFLIQLCRQHGGRGNPVSLFTSNSPLKSRTRSSESVCRTEPDAQGEQCLSLCSPAGNQLGEFGMKLQVKNKPSATKFHPQIMKLYCNFTGIILHSIPSPYLPPGSNISIKRS